MLRTINSPKNLKACSAFVLLACSFFPQNNHASSFKSLHPAASFLLETSLMPSHTENIVGGYKNIRDLGSKKCLLNVEGSQVLFGKMNPQPSQLLIDFDKLNWSTLKAVSGPKLEIKCKANGCMKIKGFDLIMQQSFNESRDYATLPLSQDKSMQNRQLKATLDLAKACNASTSAY